MPTDRVETLKKAEKLLRQGRLDAAIAEYLRIVEENPRDWTTTNTLGDLYVRAGQADKAIAQYTKIAEHLRDEGFYPRAAALYKKVLKIKPDDESVQLNLAEISAKQGLLADAKSYFVTVAARRRSRGDKKGATEILVRLGSIDASDIDARAAAARALADEGDTIGAAIRYRALHADLLDKNRAREALGALREAVRLNDGDVEGRAELAKAAVAAGDLATAKLYLDRSIAGDDAGLLMALAEIELRSGHLAPVRELFSDVLKTHPESRGRIVELAWSVADSSPAGALMCIDTVVDVELARTNFMDAAALLQEFATRVPGQIAALLKLVEICVDGGLEAVMYETQAQLADAYLEAGQGSEARVIAEDLVAREPWEHAHIDRFRRALVLLDVPDPDALIAERLSGQGPFVATDPFMPPEPFEPPKPASEEAAPPLAAPARPDVAAETGTRPAPPNPPDAPSDPAKPVAAPTEVSGAAKAATSAQPATADAAAAPPEPRPDPRKPAKKKPGGPVDIDLTSALEDLQKTEEPEPAPTRRNLEQVFEGLRDKSARTESTSQAEEHLALAHTYLEMGMTDEAADALAAAARSPKYRFEAASSLGRLYLKRSDLAHAIEWLERAAEAPAPGIEQSHELLYDLGISLESAGEVSRALAIFLELQAEAGGYRDVAARAEKLARTQSGG